MRPLGLLWVLLLTLVMVLITQDWSDLCLHPVQPVEPIDQRQVWLDGLKRQEEEDEALRRRADAFDKQGRWNVEKNIDHNAYWQQQLKWMGAK